MTSLSYVKQHNWKNLDLDVQLVRPDFPNKAYFYNLHYYIEK